MRTVKAVPIATPIAIEMNSVLNTKSVKPDIIFFICVKIFLFLYIIILFMKNKSVDLVVARYNEDISWLSKVPHKLNIIVYNKDDRRSKKTNMYSKFEIKQPKIEHPNARIISLPNIGRESDTYLYHIINNYDKLASKTIFTQGDPFIHSPDFLELLNKTDKFLPIQSLTDRYMGDTPPRKILEERTTGHIDGLRTCAYPMYFTNYQTIWFHDPGSIMIMNDFNDFFKTRSETNIVEYVLQNNGFSVENVPLIGHFCYSAIFAVNRENILKHPQNAYIKLRETNNTSNKMFPSVLERIWLYMFGYEHLC
jgi:hypothetical protein